MQVKSYSTIKILLLNNEQIEKIDKLTIARYTFLEIRQISSTRLHDKSLRILYTHGKHGGL